MSRVFALSLAVASTLLFSDTSVAAKGAAPVKLTVKPTAGQLNVRVSAKAKVRCTLKVSAKGQSMSFPKARTDQKGRVSFAWAVPADAPSGKWTFTARCKIGGKTQTAKKSALIVTSGSGKGALIEPSSLHLDDGSLGGRGAGDGTCAYDQNGKQVCSPGNPYNTYPNGPYGGECTWYAAHRRPDLWGKTTGHAKSWLDQARAKGVATGTSPAVGAIAVRTSGKYGHVMYVTAVTDGGTTIIVDDSNNGNDHVIRYGRRVATNTINGYIYGGPAGGGPGAQPANPDGQPGAGPPASPSTPVGPAPSQPAPGSGNALTAVGMSGNWVGDTRYQDFAYVTKRASGGLAIAVWESLPTGIQWRGVWLDDRVLDFDQTTFVPADQDGDGDLDLYYATKRSSGMDMALLRNTGSSFSYVGQQWNPDGLFPNNTRFLSGNFIGDSRYDDFAYVTKRAGGGLDIAVFESTPAGIQWRGVWLTNANLPFEQTSFVPADQDGDGDLDLYYAVKRPNGAGMDMALLTNTGSSFSYVGQQWNPDGLYPETTRFLVGNFVGDARYDDFAYVTKRAEGGFAIAVFESTPAGIQWRGVWLDDRVQTFDTTSFVPVDQDGDGDLDLFYATRRANGMDVALLTNTGSSFSYVGQQWNPDNLFPETTRFLPQG